MIVVNKWSIFLGLGQSLTGDEVSKRQAPPHSFPPRLLLVDFHYNEKYLRPFNFSAEHYEDAFRFTASQENLLWPRFGEKEQGITKPEVEIIWEWRWVML